MMRNQNGRLVVAGACAFGLLSFSLPASAAFTQKQCFPYYADVPLDLGAREFPQWHVNPTNYTNNENRGWSLLVNSNVYSGRFYYTNFQTEACCDYVGILHDSAGVPVLKKIQGNLGTGYTSPTLRPVFPGTSAQLYGTSWVADGFGNYARANARLDKVRIYCNGVTNPTASTWPISANTRTDGLLLGTSDVIYSSVTQPAGTRMLLNVDSLASDDAAPDIDVYASLSTPLPDFPSSDWVALHSNSNGLPGAGEVIDFGYSASARTIYFGVRSYRGAHHFTVRASAVKTSTSGDPLGYRTITVCHPRQGPNIQTFSNWPAARETLERTSLRVQAMTQGNIYIRRFQMKYLASNGGDNFCTADSSCDWCMTDAAIDPDFCGAQSEGLSLGANTRIPNILCTPAYSNPGSLSWVLAHEAGHSLLGLDDEYQYPEDPQPGAVCGHSLMNGPAWDATTLCTQWNHCDDGPSPPLSHDCTSSGNNWSVLQNGTRAGWFYNFLSGGATQSAIPWRTLPASPWARSNIVFTFQ